MQVGPREYALIVKKGLTCACPREPPMRQNALGAGNGAGRGHDIVTPGGRNRDRTRFSVRGKCFLLVSWVHYMTMPQR